MRTRFSPASRASTSATTVALGATLTLLAAGCTLHRPDATAPVIETATGRFTAEPLPEVTASVPITGGRAQRFVVGREVPREWWKLYHSTQLNNWVDEAFRNSPSLAAAAARLRASQEQYNAVRASLLPDVSLSGNATRARTSAIAFGVPGTIDYTLYGASVNANYTFDAFGGVRSNIAAQQALLVVQQVQAEATYTTLAGNIVTAALALAAAQAQLDDARTIADGYDDTVKLIETQFRIGTIPRSSVVSIQSEAVAARTQIPALELTVTQARNKLATLIGRTPDAMTPAEVAPFRIENIELPEEIPVGVPSELARRRPDLLAAEAQLQAASQQVGVARAALYPSFSITASYGLQSGKLSDFFSSDPIWSLGGAIATPILFRKRLNANERASVATFEATRLTYKATVLDAFRQVADSLAAVTADARSLRVRQEAFLLAQQSATLAERRNRIGGGTLLEVIDARRTLAQVSSSRTQAAAARYQDTAVLFLALGGGWSQATTASTAMIVGSGGTGSSPLSPSTSVTTGNASGAAATAPASVPRTAPGVLPGSTTGTGTGS